MLERIQTLHSNFKEINFPYLREKHQWKKLTFNASLSGDDGNGKLTTLSIPRAWGGKR